jgi:hypothetical protein
MPIAAWLDAETLRSFAGNSHASAPPISSWLSPAYSPPSSIKAGKKRGRRHTSQTSDIMPNRDFSPSKRPRLDSADPTPCTTEDVENTPRASSNIAIAPPSPSSFASSQTSPSSISRRSRSPRKKQPLRKMANLSLLPNPVVMRSFDDAAAAPSTELEAIVLRLKLIGRGIGIIPRSAKVSHSSKPCSLIRRV